jgi:hypothetical protein
MVMVTVSVFSKLGAEAVSVLAIVAGCDHPIKNYSSGLDPFPFWK